MSRKNKPEVIIRWKIIRDHWWMVPDVGVEIVDLVLANFNTEDERYDFGEYFRRSLKVHIDYEGLKDKIEALALEKFDDKNIKFIWKEDK